MSQSYENTVKPVCKGHSTDQKIGSKTFTNYKNRFFRTIYFINYIFHLPLTSFHCSLFLSWRYEIFISHIVIRRMQGFQMSSKGLHMLCWLNKFSEQILNMHSKYIKKLTSFYMLVSAIFFKILPIFTTSFKQIF